VKWVIGLLLVLLVAYGALKGWTHWVANARVAENLRSDPNGERAARVMLLRLPDGSELPVNYLREGDLVFAGADGRWWRAFREGGASVTLVIRGETLTGHARVVLDDPVYRDDVFRRLRPNVPAWLPDWLDARLVVVELEH
jgi:hypothetical protein